ncbi:hypothetical protein OG331_47060 [Streptomyces sp. NBC_01017]|uniref:hypothetical protein n=1 Tax=Streptomyces sp. NBC_01017 TaxID=2903721 RepID=UPI003866EFDD|nr:hypothetical protein OG331_47060 [Streptomyces sp. NBC_01017]
MAKRRCTVDFDAPKHGGNARHAQMVSLVVVLRISGWECAGVCPGRTSTGECRSLNRGWATA